jgi:response regulator NasT
VSSREELEARKTIERAKGVLMKERGWSEEEAFREMRKSAMDRRKSMKEIAEAILLSKEMKA